MSIANSTLTTNCIQQIRELIIHGELLHSEQIKENTLKSLTSWT